MLCVPVDRHLKSNHNIQCVLAKRQADTSALNQGLEQRAKRQPTPIVAYWTFVALAESRFVLSSQLWNQRATSPTLCSFHTLFGNILHIPLDGFSSDCVAMG